jgi:hypothetical protein
MADVIAEPTGAVMSGTDAASPAGKPAVDIILDSRGGEASADVKAQVDAQPTLVKVLAKMRAKEAADEAAAEAPAPDAPPDDEQPEAEPEADPDAPVDPEAKPAEPVADTPDVAELKAQHEAARAETASLRQQLQSAQAAEPSEDERLEYINDPIATVRRTIARTLRVAPDHKLVDEELASIQRELTIRAIGDTNLDKDRSAQRSLEQSERRWRLDQQARAADRETATHREKRSQAVRFIASLYEQTKAEYPALALATDLDGRDPADVAMDVYLGALQSGQIKADARDDEAAREALRLTNRLYSTKADKLRRHVTAPAQVPAPAQASATDSKPGAPPAPSPPVAKATPAPRTLSARQAAAAPVANKQPGQNPRRTIIEIDPNDRDARNRRAREIAERRFAKPGK